MNTFGKKLFVALALISLAVPLSATHAAPVGTLLGTYTVPIQPRSMVFEPSTKSIWVNHLNLPLGTTYIYSTDQRADMKMRASDGVVMGNYITGQGSFFAEDLAVDRSTNSVWSSGYNVGGIINKFRASDGAVIGTYPIPGPNNLHATIAFDPTTNSIWAVSPDSGAYGTGPGVIAKMRASDGGTVATYGNPDKFSEPYFDPLTNTILLASNKSATLTLIQRRNPSDGSVLGSFNINGYMPHYASPMAFDSSTNSIWVGTGAGVGSPILLYKLRASDGAVIGAYSIGASYSVGAMTFDPTTNSIWAIAMNGMMGISANTLVQVRASDGAILGARNVGGMATGVEFDPASNAIWVSSVMGNAVMKYATGSTTASGTVSVSSNIPSASWTLLGPSSIETGSGATASYVSKPVGAYTIVWNAVPGYTTPPTESLSIVNSGDVLTFSGAYTPIASTTPACLPAGWTAPTNASACSAADPLVDTNYQIVASCGASPSKCLYTCDGGYYPNTSTSCVATQCNDGIDNDGDGLLNMADPGCLNTNDMDETDTPPTITALPRTVTEGSQTTISWDTNNSNEPLCTLSGGAIVGNPLATDGGDETGSVNVPVSARTMYTVTCPTGSASVTVDIVPIGFES